MIILIYMQAFEVDTYLRALQSEVLQKRCVTLSIPRLWPEVGVTEL